jgi:hypothetical protein
MAEYAQSTILAWNIAAGERVPEPGCTRVAAIYRLPATSTLTRTTFH